MRRILVLLLAAALLSTGAAKLPRTTTPPWRSPGLIGSGGWPFAREAVDPELAEGASYLPGSSVLALPDGRARLIPFGSSAVITVSQSDPRVAETVKADQDWLAAGTVPGTTAADKAVSARALLDLRLLTEPGGASTASWYGSWDYVWPRDGAFAAAAFAATGHDDDAQRILYFLARAQSPSGLWAARYRPDGTAVIDGRAAQLDSLGWVLWGTWFLHQKDPQAANIDTLLPMVSAAADRAARSLRRNGLPPPSPDYWERPPATEQAPRMPTLGVCAPMLAGLRAATALAEERGDGTEVRRWRGAADRLGAAIGRYFAPYGYPRSPIRGGALDSSVTFMAPPFAAADPAVTAAVTKNAHRLELPTGGVVPGEHYGTDLAWTPETALFALANAASGDQQAADHWLGWLAGHRSSLGSFPEKIDRAGRQAGVAPLGWTSSLVILAYAAEDSPLPIVPTS